MGKKVRKLKFRNGTVFLFFCLAAFNLNAQNLSVFTSVTPAAQTQRLVLPPSHDFQLLAQFGDSLADGTSLSTAPDFTAFIPKNGQSDSGYLALQHEISNLQGRITVFDLAFDPGKQLWEIEPGHPIDFSEGFGINKPCSGGITPWGTVISGEESILTSDLDSNGYYDGGWLVESRPSDRKFIQKIWKAGNAQHENCCVSADLRTVYWGADDALRGFVFKYVTKEERNLTQGALFVLRRNGFMASTGTWVLVPNQTPAECNSINTFCEQIGAWNFSGIEDVEIGPNGIIYFAAKYSGRIWRFKDDGATISGLGVFVENTAYPIQTKTGIIWTPWGIGADNLAFDQDGNLWVLQDGDNNHIWVVKPTHTAFHPQIALFATTPAGSEPTGITFSPNNRFLFLSFQHPNTSNSDSVMDVSGKRFVFNRGTTLVIARKEFLGANPCCPQQIPEVPGLTGIKFRCAPNPSNNGQVSLYAAEFQKGDLVVIRVFDPLGAICHESIYHIEEEEIQLNFETSTKGAYVISAEINGKMGRTILLVE